MSRLGSGSLVIATHNAGKLKEISALLDPYGVKCISAGSLGLPEPAETGTTFTENALIKARASAEASGMAALADDSGLSVDALGGRPGVYTADWAERQWFEGEAGRDWFMAMGKVEGLLQAQGPDASRACAFHCVLALAWPDGEHAVYEGTAPGSLVWPPRGNWASATIRYSYRKGLSRHSQRSIRRKSMRSATAPMPLRSWSPTSSAELRQGIATPRQLPEGIYRQTSTSFCELLATAQPTSCVSFQMIWV